MNKQHRHIESLIEFLDKSPVNFLAVRNIEELLQAKDFKKLKMSDRWEIIPGGKYYTTQNDSSIFAFIAPGNTPGRMHIISAHSDSPTFRVKPNCEMLSDGRMLKLNTEVYGGPILYTWFDRPLSLAGRVILRGEDGSPFNVETRMVKFDRPMMTIPHLAIHFNRAVNEGNPLSRQKDMLPVVGRLPESEDYHGWLKRQVASELNVDVDHIIDYDLSVYDTTGACVVGAFDDFVSSGRLDDLSMVHAAMTAMTEADEASEDTLRIMAIFDNEETGSGTKQGAGSPILDYIARRVYIAMGADEEDYLRSVADSFMISADNAHGVHPNYVEKQDPTNHPVLGDGPVVKINANCKYMTDARSSAIFTEICRVGGVEPQYFVNHSDVIGGSTLGNILTSQIPLNGVDMGAAVWAMHSARETASVADHLSIIRAFTTFYNLRTTR
ncbi:MAG: M18 family aminopeptidase [Muribaculaceae bacterium]|nr:M18 family aminopeptidase [Muribaculaceae bacterium]